MCGKMDIMNCFIDNPSKIFTINLEYETDEDVDYISILKKTFSTEIYLGMIYTNIKERRKHTLLLMGWEIML